MLVTNMLQRRRVPSDPTLAEKNDDLIVLGWTLETVKSPDSLNQMNLNTNKRHLNIVLYFCLLVLERKMIRQYVDMGLTCIFQVFASIENQISTCNTSYSSTVKNITE